MKIQYSIIHCILLFILTACQPAGDEKHPPKELDYSKLMDVLEKKLGERFINSEMNGMKSTAFQYSGEFHKVVKWVSPTLIECGFKKMDQDMEDMLDQMKADMPEQQPNGFDMKDMKMKGFEHPNGDRFSISQVTMGESSLLMIQLINWDKMQKSLEGFQN